MAVTLRPPIPASELDRLGSRVDYVVDADNVIVATGGLWGRFAAENGSASLRQGVGLDVIEATSGDPLRYLWREILDAARKAPGQLVLTYRCDAPTARRRFRMTLTSDDRARVSTTSLLVMLERRPDPLTRTFSAVGSITVTRCSWCNRFDAGDWLELEDAVVRLDLFRGVQIDRVTHGICPRCAETVSEVLATL